MKGCEQMESSKVVTQDQIYSLLFELQQSDDMHKIKHMTQKLIAYHTNMENTLVMNDKIKQAWFDTNILVKFEDLNTKDLKARYGWVQNHPIFEIELYRAQMSPEIFNTFYPNIIRKYNISPKLKSHVNQVIAEAQYEPLKTFVRKSIYDILQNYK